MAPKFDKAKKMTQLEIIQAQLLCNRPRKNFKLIGRNHGAPALIQIKQAGINIEESDQHTSKPDKTLSDSAADSNQGKAFRQNN